MAQSASFMQKEISNKHIIIQDTETESKSREIYISQHLHIEGWLFKKSRVLKKWRRRWMVLAGNTLYSYKNERKYNQQPTEKIDIRNIVLIRKHMTPQYTNYKFDIELEKKLIFTFKTDIDTNRDIWCNEMNKLINLNSCMVITKESKKGPILSFGCRHFRRNCSYLCSCCDKWYFCSYCHDGIESGFVTGGHQLQRKNIIAMKCCNCGKEQKANKNCIKCNICMAYYFCAVCKFWDNDCNHLLFHCTKCGVCRSGNSIDYQHCDKCGVCLANAFYKHHKCIEQSTKCDCPICGEYLHCTDQPVTFWTHCGHAIHVKCMEEYLQYDTLCAICREPWCP